MDETRLDKIEIKELEVFANHGVYPEENVLGQKFVISATLFTRTRLAGLTDELSASINYGEVSHMITDFTRKHTYKLLESLAENLAEMLLCSLSGLEKITLKIEKGILLTLLLALIWFIKDVYRQWDPWSGRDKRMPYRGNFRLSYYRTLRSY